MSDVEKLSPSPENVSLLDIKKDKTVATNDANNDMNTITKTGNEVWVFIVIAIVVLVVCFVIAKPGMEWFNDLNTTAATRYMWIWAVILTIAYIVAAYYTSVGYYAATPHVKTGIMLSFIAFSLLLLVWFFVLFKMKEITSAFYVSIALLFVLFIQMYLCWATNLTAGLGNIGIMLMAFILVGFSYNLSAANTQT